MDDNNGGDFDDRTIFEYVTDTLLWPIRVATSPALLRTYLRTALLLLTSTILFGFAVVAYTSLYYSYIPVRGITVPVYLQYDHGPTSFPSTDGILRRTVVKWPYGLANVHGLVDRQKYDITVEMDVPRSERNLDAGNWMIGLEMRGPATSGSGGSGVLHMLGWDEEWEGEHLGEERPPQGGYGNPHRGKPTVLARSRRPGLLTYRSPLIELAYRLLRLPLYVVNWHTESEHIEVSMMEGVTFEQGHRNIPSSLRLELRAKHPLEVYRAVVRISAKLEGLRWLMYRHWISSAAVGILMFWSVEMGVLVCTWALFTLLFGRPAQDADEQEHQTTKPTDKKPSKQPTTAIKQEPGTDPDPETPHSDTPRTFPTLPSQQPLSYTHPNPNPKSEPPTPQSLHDIPPAPEDAEADDEDDDFVLGDPVPLPREAAFTDSGIGTSLESVVERGLARRRSGRLREEGRG
ncbi:hypothetical protein IQ07DRAFT_588111 [Pyrenochaeta sp. DS3sAY3a]|nr:hypothetical protein IQ07DRAFT_588111 [Pyrenochaeta sp. DS3sAY3a]